MRHKLLLLTANLLTLIILFYFLDVFGYVKTYSKIKDQIISTEVVDNIPTPEERRLEIELAEEEDRKKVEAFLQEKEEQLQALQDELNAQQETLQEERLALSKERENLLMLEERLAVEEEELNNYSTKVTGLASRFYNMQPQLASERILALEDDLLIIDVLAAMDDVAAGRGQQSIVPYLFSLMPPADAARILKKSTVSL